MNDNTINGDKTVTGGGNDVTLAGRYHIIRQLGQGGISNNAIFVICEKISNPAWFRTADMV